MSGNDTEIPGIWNCFFFFYYFFSVALSEVAFGKPKSQWNNHTLQSFSIGNTVPPIVMEVENRALEDEVSLQNGHFPTSMILGERVDLECWPAMLVF